MMVAGQGEHNHRFGCGAAPPAWPFGLRSRVVTRRPGRPEKSWGFRVKRVWPSTAPQHPEHPRRGRLNKRNMTVTKPALDPQPSRNGRTFYHRPTDQKYQLGYSLRMEKRTPHCKLAVVKALVEAGKVSATRAARTGAAGLGLELSDMLAVVMALTPEDFYKSMTTYADHTVWQDVYRPSTQAGGRLVPKTDGHQ